MEKANKSIKTMHLEITMYRKTLISYWRKMMDKKEELLHSITKQQLQDVGKILAGSFAADPFSASEVLDEVASNHYQYCEVNSLCV
jgi:hypothetical protein